MKYDDPAAIKALGAARRKLLEDWGADLKEDRARYELPDDEFVKTCTPEQIERRSRKWRQQARTMRALIGPTVMTRSATRPLIAEPRAPRRTNGPSGRPRAQATRSSAASGDSGDSDGSEGEPAGAPPRGHLLDILRCSTPFLRGHQRLRLFHSAPERVQRAAWGSLARAVERGGS